MLLAVDVNVQPALERVDELHSRVHVQPDVVARHGKELGELPVEPPLGRGIVQRLEAIRHLLPILMLWQAPRAPPDRRLRLSADLKLPGRGWLEFEVTPLDDGRRSLIRQTATFALEACWAARGPGTASSPCTSGCSAVSCTRSRVAPSYAESSSTARCQSASISGKESERSDRKCAEFEQRRALSGRLAERDEVPFSE